MAWPSRSSCREPKAWVKRDWQRGSTANYDRGNSLLRAENKVLATRLPTRRRDEFCSAADAPDSRSDFSGAGAEVPELLDGMSSFEPFDHCDDRRC